MRNLPSRRALLRVLASTGVAGGVLQALRGVSQAARFPVAPEFAGIDGWLNTGGPLTIAGLRGRVVLVDFWTYSCINCRRTVPYLNRWEAEYGPQGLQVVGIHTPEFGFERMRRNVEDSVRAFGIRFPVGQDNAFATWRAWGNRAWPAFYLLDRDGQIVLVREGEGHAHELEGAIQALLGLPPITASARPSDDPDLSRVLTPEIYFGSQHGTPQDRAQKPRGGEATYRFSAAPGLNEYQLNGTWERREEALVLRSVQGGLRVRFSAAKFHLVASSPDGALASVRVDGAAPQSVAIGRPTLYTLLDGETPGEHLLDLAASAPGLALFSATFG